MKIILLSDANSIHTLKWVESISQKGFNIQLFSLFKPTKYSLKKYKQFNVKITSPGLRSKINKIREPNLSKFIYLQSIPLLKRTIKKFEPDILHAHYASSYGVLGLLSGFKPFILSVWGSDIYHFPYKNRFNKWLISRVITNSNFVCSTSNVMKKIIEKEYKRFDIKVIPFGVDIELFKKSNFHNKIFTVGTIKSIENHNGLDCLLDAAKLVIHNYKKDINFIIVGDGLLRKAMEQKALDLNIEDKIKFTGFVNHENVIKYYNKLSVFVAVSKRESFGVSILEAAACEIPSITSNIGGLIEVNLHNETGIVINPNDPQKLAESIMKLYKDEKLRFNMGVNARKRVVEQYNWKNNVDQMISVYKSYI